MRCLNYMFCAVVVGALTFASGAARAGCDDCNLLWIVVDTTREDFLGAYGNPDGNTPNIDRVASRGLIFHQAYAQGPSTMISVGSYFSGRYRRNVGLDFTLGTRAQRFQPMPSEITTVAEALGDAGFTTRGATANMVIGGAGRWNLDFHQGFEDWKKMPDEEVVVYGAQQLEALAAERNRFFVYLHLMGPHYPNREIDGFDDRRGQHDKVQMPQDGHLYRDIRSGTLGLTDKQLDYVRALYADGLWQADDRLKTVFDALEKTGLTDKTLVIITSDHGEALGENHRGAEAWGHGHALDEVLLHVPLVLAGPGVPQGQQTDQVAELVDLAPTIAGLLDVKVDPAWKWDGTPLIGTGAEKGEWSIADRGASPKTSASIRDAKHVVLWQEAKDRSRFIDLGNDPDEEQFIKSTPRHDTLDRLLREYLLRANAPAVEPMEDPDEATIQQLQQLGYLTE